MLLILCHLATGFLHRGELAVMYRSDVCRYNSVHHLHITARDFDTGVFDCCDGRHVLWNIYMACCCSPVYYAVDASATGFMGFWLALVLTSIFLPFIWIFGFLARMHIRKEFYMGSSVLCDCLAWFFCVPCVLIQENKFMHRTFTALRDGTDNIEILPYVPVAIQTPPVATPP